MADGKITNSEPRAAEAQSALQNGINNLSTDLTATIGETNTDVADRVTSVVSRAGRAKSLLESTMSTDIERIGTLSLGWQEFDRDRENQNRNNGLEM